MSFISISLVFLLALVLLAPFIFEKKEFITPLKIYSFFSILTTIPYLLTILSDPTEMHPDLLAIIGRNQIQDAIYYYMLIQGIASIAVYLGFYSISTHKKATNISPHEEPHAEKTLYFFSLVALLITLLSFYIKLQAMGGLSYLLNHIESRSELGAGTGYISFLFGTMLYLSVLLYTYSFKYNKNKKKFAVLILLFILAFLMLTIFGGRKPFLHLIIFTVILWNYAVNKIERLTATQVILVLILLVYFISVLLLRKEGALEEYTYNPSLFFSDFSDNLGSFFNNLSYVDAYVFITNHFDSDNYWYGAVYLDLLQAPIPSSIFPDKPPIDEGVYIRSLIDGMEVSPPTPFYKMFPSSWPPETLGNGYANFGVIGVIIWMFTLGLIFKIAYNLLLKNPNPLNIYLFALILVGFHISNLRIMQLIMNFVIAWVFLKPIFSKRGTIKRYIL